MGGGDDIQFFIGIRNAQILLEDLHELAGDIEDIFQVRSATFSGNAAKRHFMFTEFVGRQRRTLHHIEGTDGQRKQIGGHGAGGREADFLKALPGRHARFRGGIGNGRVAFGHCQADREGRLETRLVETRQIFPGLNRFGFRQCVGMAFFFHAKEPRQILVEGRRIDQGQGDGPYGKGLSEIDPRHARGQHLNIGGGPCRSVRGRYMSLRNADSVAVKPDTVGGFGQLDGDRHRSGKLRLAGIDSHIEFVGMRQRRAGEPAPGGCRLESLDVRSGPGAGGLLRIPGRCFRSLVRFFRRLTSGQDNQKYGNGS